MEDIILDILRKVDGNGFNLIKTPKPENFYKEFKSFNDRFQTSTEGFTDLSSVIFLGLEYNDSYVVPDYQRDLKWTKSQKQNLIISVLLGNPIGDFLFKEDNPSGDGYTYEYSVIDGQQRINALREFAAGKLKLPDGRTLNDLEYHDSRAFFAYRTFGGFKIKNLSKSDELKLYLEKNNGGTNHTKKELDKARDILTKLTK